MAEQVPECEAHRSPTRLTCAECGTPICPRCLVKTRVGLKCAEHAQAVVPHSHRRTATTVVGALVALAAAVTILALAVLRPSSKPAPVPVGGPTGTKAPAAAGRIEPAQVFVVNADGTAPHTLTNRPLAFDANPAWSPDGTRIAFESTADGKRAVWIMQSDGQRLRRVTEGPGSDAAPAWSPDNSHIAFMSDRDGNSEIYVIGADGSGMRRLTQSPGIDGFPAWSPDGARIAFVSDRDGQLGLWGANADGTGPARLVPGTVATARPAWSPDGRSLAFSSDRDGGNLEVYVARADGTSVTRITDDPGQDGEPAWSPDGSRLAFASDRDGGAEVYAVNRDGSGLRKLTTRPRSFAPSWAPDGTRLAYINDPVPGG